MKAADIRPQELHQRYIELSAQDAKVYFGKEARKPVACVACGSTETTPEFEKLGFQFSRCSECRTLYQSPRPASGRFEEFYKESKSAKYWANCFFPAVAEIRREKIFQPRVTRLMEICQARNIQVNCLVDVGAGYGIFLEEWIRCSPHVTPIAVEPSQPLARACREKGLRVEEAPVEKVSDLKDRADLVVCFEVLEHVHNPLSFMKKLVDIVRPGGLLMVSTLCIDGFDLQILGKLSQQISPPHHINFCSIDGFKRLFSRCGLEEVSVTTPGVLDVDIVESAMMDEAENIELPAFVKAILSNEMAAVGFQQFLTKNLLSSHAWITGIKPGGH